MDSFPIIDPHHHFLDVDRFSYPWLMDKPQPPNVAGDLAPIAHSYLLDDYLDDTAAQNLVKSVHIEAGIGAFSPIEETIWLQRLADKRGFPNGIVAYAELNAPDVEAMLSAHADFRNVRGIRHIVNWHKDSSKTYVNRPDLLTDKAWLAGFDLLQKYDLSFDLQLYPSQMVDAARLAHNHPSTRIILNHAGMPVDRNLKAIELWRTGMQLLAEESNVWVKISGLGMVDWQWTEQSIRPFVLETIEMFGIDRTMFASNFPVDKLYSNFNVLYSSFRNIVNGFDLVEKEKLFHGNAAVAYRL